MSRTQLQLALFAHWNLDITSTALHFCSCSMSVPRRSKPVESPLIGSTLFACQWTSSIGPVAVLSLSTSTTLTIAIPICKDVHARMTALSNTTGFQDARRASRPVAVLLSWMCLSDLFDMRQTVTSVGGLVPWRSCWVSCQTSSLVFFAEYHTSSSYILVREIAAHGYHLLPSFGSRVYHHPRPGPCRHGPRCTGALGMLGTLTVTLTKNVRGVSGSMSNSCQCSRVWQFSVVAMVSMVIPSNLAWVRSGGLAAATERLMAHGTAVTIGAESGMFSTWSGQLHACAHVTSEDSGGGTSGFVMRVHFTVVRCGMKANNIDKPQDIVSFSPIAEAPPPAWRSGVSKPCG